ncbi:bifunctional cytidylyltransferase/SDR family oxidoreductase [Streptomyces sp. NBC_00102]|uniref:bifunctional cytidylyltransferase/SDR family oxidoreductase n=1 Tax=Streptomyces sp. NBC_00102 TaxID=2975652 RepID=UPI002251EAA3|nr:bifunctional cytidylyltransferase/SDR family oxidoreductase [Streptomyces sp. NBC_00102]MCX5400516.1 bifunctional cytidylyltransferase/SDR family oxidoreductase [Streptomyces sp. NBC_00102]
MSSSATRRRTVAVVLAGGTGQRVGLAVPKQLLKIAGRSILEHTLHVFEDVDEVDEVVVLMPRDHLAEARRIIARAELTKVSRVLAGGTTRNGTTAVAIEAVAAGLGDGEDCDLLFHDAVRPLLSGRVVRECVAALERHTAVDVAIPSSDTVIVTRTHGEDGEFITEVPERDRLRRGQTPQGFRLSTIRDAYRLAAADPLFRATDDCSVVVRYLPDVPVHVIMGDEHNMKVTQPVDVFVADKLFQLASTTAPEGGTDASRRKALTGRTLVVFGGAEGLGADVARLAEGYGAHVHACGHPFGAEDAERELATAHAESGRIDFVVNAASRLPVGRLAETGPAAIQEALRTHYLAPVVTARAAYPYLARTKGQLLLFTGSSYTHGRAGYSVHSSANAAMVNLTQALSEEWSEDGVRVNCMNPERGSGGLPAGTGRPDDSAPSSREAARSALDVLLSCMSGRVIDVRTGSPAPRGSAFDAALSRILDASANDRTAR